MSIYEYPRGCVTEHDLASYMSAIMTHAARGAKVQILRSVGGEWKDVVKDSPLWNWADFKYRIAREEETDDDAIRRIAETEIHWEAEKQIMSFSHALLAWERSK